MNIITVFNYPDEDNYNVMFKNWVYQALRCKYQTKGIDKVKILTEKINQTCIDFVKVLNTDDIEIVIKNRIPLKKCST